MSSLTPSDEKDYALDGRGVVVNTNRAAYEEYMNKKKIMEAKDGEIEAFRQEINNVKNELSQIQNLLKQLLAQGNK